MVKTRPRFKEMYLFTYLGYDVIGILLPQQNAMASTHRHLKIIDCLTARVFFISTVNSRSKKKKPILRCASSGHNKQT
jgi:hypothetical protein